MNKQKQISMYPAVAVIIFDEQKRILLQKRADVGLWTIPAGHVEPGETVEEAAVREVYQDTGLVVDPYRLIGVYSDPESQTFEYPDGRLVQFVTSYFEAEITGGTTTKKDPSLIELEFFAPNKLPHDLLPMHPRWLVDAFSDRPEAFVR
ncbi:NUDIX domain-containing protein [Sutcliffiella horikoshii]|uniref:NUDIX domain-containing protein n=2 Tax=Sutcliffiella horikoshii TaxID=79883 RepID=A0A5D4SX47_9BACI|nr:NUDIX domain-containing protein [Sutcliffiella horikoshii]